MLNHMLCTLRLGIQVQHGALLVYLPLQAWQHSWRAAQLIGLEVVGVKVAYHVDCGPDCRTAHSLCGARTLVQLTEWQYQLKTHLSSDNRQETEH